MIINYGLARMMPLCLAVVFFTLSMLFAPQPGFAGDEVVAAFPRYFPPQFKLDSQGKPTGFSIDVMDMIAAEAGIKMKYMPLATWNDVNQAIDRKEAVLVPDMGIISSRENRYDFTKPTATFKIVLFVRGASDDINSLSDLAGRRIAVVKTNVGNQLIKDNHDVIKVTYDDMAQAFFDLIAGYIDGFIYPEPPILNLAAEAGLRDKIKIAGPSFLEVKRGIAVSKGHPDLVAKLNDAISKVTKTEAYRELYTKWFGSEPAFWTARRVFVTTAGVAALVLIFMVFWRFVSITKLNRKLRTSEAEYRSLAENTQDMIIRLDPDHNVLFANRPILSQFAAAGGDVSGKKIDQSGFPLELATLIKEMVNKTIQNKTGQNQSYRFKDGNQEKIIDWFFLPEMDDRGSLNTVLGVGRDVTKLFLAEEKKRELEEKLGQKLKMEAIGRLAGGVAHDFNNLLSVIIGSAELAKDDVDEGGDLIQDLDQIIETGWRARHLTGQLLAFSRRQVLDLKPVNINSVIRNSENILKRIIGEDVAVNSALDDSIPNVTADFHQLEQILINLAVNSRDAMPTGGNITIETSCVESKEGFSSGGDDIKAGRYVAITMTDSGLGMDQETREKAFDPFFTTKQKGKGTGLGLSTIHGIVQQHGGYVTISSQLGEGTSVKILLPASCETDQAPASMAVEAEIKGGCETILVAEDEAQILAFVAKALTRLGYRVLTASSPKEAVTIFEVHGAEIDLLLTDVIMPDTSGKMLYMQLKNKSPRLDVVYMSGYTDNIIAHHGVLDSGVHFLAKPFSCNQLAVKIRSVLDSKT